MSIETRNYLTGEILTKNNIAGCLQQIASQEANDGEPYDQMVFAAEVIDEQANDIRLRDRRVARLEKAIKSLEDLLKVKDAGMKALEEENEKLYGMVKPLQIMYKAEAEEARKLREALKKIGERSNAFIKSEYLVFSEIEEIVRIAKQALMVGEG